MCRLRTVFVDVRIRLARLCLRAQPPAIRLYFEHCIFGQHCFPVVESSQVGIWPAARCVQERAFVHCSSARPIIVPCIAGISCVLADQDPAHGERRLGFAIPAAAVCSIVIRVQRSIVRHGNETIKQIAKPSAKLLVPPAAITVAGTNSESIGPSSIAASFIDRLWRRKGQATAPQVYRQPEYYEDDDIIAAVSSHHGVAY